MGSLAEEAMRERAGCERRAARRFLRIHAPSSCIEGPRLLLETESGAFSYSSPRSRRAQSPPAPHQDVARLIECSLTRTLDMKVAPRPTSSFRHGITAP